MKKITYFMCFLLWDNKSVPIVYKVKWSAWQWRYKCICICFVQNKCIFVFSKKSLTIVIPIANLQELRKVNEKKKELKKETTRKLRSNDQLRIYSLLIRQTAYGWLAIIKKSNEYSYGETTYQESTVNGKQHKPLQSLRKL